MAETATLNFRGTALELPVFEGSEKEAAVDISSLRGKTGAITYDDGYGNTGACKSGVTFLDGEQGILRYRGYPIEQLANEASFLEVGKLLIDGELPSRDALAAFSQDIGDAAELPAEISAFFAALPVSTHPMAAIAAGVVALSGWDKQADDFGQFDRLSKSLLGKLPLLVAGWYRRTRNEKLPAWDKSASYSTNFLRAMFDKDVDPEIAEALDVLFILHADHEQNCSTSTVRMVGSSHANLYASISAGITALWGPLHGGANQEVLEMLERIQADGGDMKKVIAQAKDKTSGFRLMGFGHRVYKNFDPRARIIKKHADKVLGKLGIQDPLLDIAKQLEQGALEDAYFVDRKLYPNVDFYSGIIYRAMGFPTEFFTPLFAIGRLPGWVAQWKEMRDSNARIGRPRQIYTGATERNYLPADKR